MNDEYLWEPVNREILCEIIDPFTFRALVSALLHSFWLNKGLYAGLQFNFPCYPHGCTRYGNTQIHEIVEGVRLMMTSITLETVHQLASE